MRHLPCWFCKDIQSDYFMTNDTICAISTAPGIGGVAVIRVSGKESIAICSKLFHPHKKGKDLSCQKAYTLSYGAIIHGKETVDDVVAALFRSPHSFTGEDTVELTCHGSLYIQQRILELLLAHGCRMARPGEFTQRAFLNGKMDLAQAEAVADLIASTSEGQHRLAMNQMKGGFSKELKNLRKQLLEITSLMELELDFADHEELEFADRSELKKLASQIENAMLHLAHSFKAGNAIKNGIPVAIIGKTNAGKSTLLNRLLNEDKAIVSAIHGTTRDVIEDTTLIKGQLFRFIDTAGIRNTTDAIENLGIERTFQKIEQSSIVLWMIDAVDALQQIKEIGNDIFHRCKNKQLIIVLNKVDLIETQLDLKHLIPTNMPIIYISAKEGKNVEELQRKLTEATQITPTQQGDIIVSNVRHFEALNHALDSIHRVQDGLENNLSGEFISQDLRECIFHLSNIVGEVTTDQVLGNIFSHFCVGK